MFVFTANCGVGTCTHTLQCVISHARLAQCVFCYCKSQHLALAALPSIPCHSQHIVSSACLLPRCMPLPAKDKLTASLIAVHCCCLLVPFGSCSQLLKASHEQQGLKKSHSQPANYSSDSLESMLSNNGNNPSTPRSQLRARILKSATEHGLVAPRSLGGPACSSSGGKASAGGAGHGKGKSNLGLPHSASSPTVALQRGGSAGSSPAGSPRKLTLGASSCSSASGEECGCSKGWAGSVSSLFGYRKSCKRLHLEPAQQQQQTAPGEQPKVAVQKSDGAAQTGASLCGGAGAVAHGSLIEESSSSQVVHPGSRELCVGRQKERVAASPAADLVAELAALPGRQQSPHPKDFFLDSEEPEAVGGCSTELTGTARQAAGVCALSGC